MTVDLNGYTLTGAKDSAVFEVQEGYTLTIVDNSEAKTGKLVSDARRPWRWPRAPFPKRRPACPRRS